MIFLIYIKPFPLKLQEGWGNFRAVRENSCFLVIC